jgi:hypothetical protein
MKELMTLEQFIEVQQFRLKRFQKAWELASQYISDANREKLWPREMEYREWEAKERIIFEKDMKEVNKNNDL